MPKSSSTADSEQDSLIKLVELDQVRYQRKGYGLFFASILTFGFFFILPRLIQPVYDMLPYDQPAMFYCIGTLLLQLAIFWVSNLGMHFIYKGKYPFFEKYRISNDPWPWEADPEKFSLHLKKTIKTVLINQVLITGSMIVGVSLIGCIDKRFSPLEYPEPIEIITHIVFFMLCEDMTFYWSHRLLHSPSLYKRIHKVHHEHSTTIGLASYYSHPFEFVFSNIIPSNLGALILGSKVHVITYWMWVALRVSETVDGHCGYEFSWSPFRLIPFSGSAEYHNYHHSHNVGNFGSFFTLWDSLCKTNRWYHRHLEKKRQLEENVEKLKVES